MMSGSILTNTCRYFTLAMAGHVDHGKTSLVKALTGINPDRLKEEQERQMTTDLGFAHLHLGAVAARADEEERQLVLGFIDVPGHGKFLKNMLAGVGGIDTALLVVAADEGPMPQTLQHIKILSLLGVKSCLVALTKIDLADSEAIDLAKIAVCDMLAAYNLQVLAVAPVNAVGGAGINELKEVLREIFWQRCLSKPAGQSGLSGSEPVYLPIDRVFSKSGHGTVITGTLVEGCLAVGQQIAIEPGKISARVRSLETFGQKVESARAGQRVAANLALKENLSLSRGHALTGGGRQSCVSLIVELFDAGGLEFFGETNEVAEPKNAAAHQAFHKHVIGAQAIKLYHGTAELRGSLRWLEPMQSGGGKRYLAQIYLAEPVLARPGDRYVVRYGDDGIGGGRILLCHRPRWLTRRLLLENAELLASFPPQVEQVLALLLSASPRPALKREELSWAVPDYLLSALPESSAIVCELAGHLMAATVKEGIEASIVSALLAQSLTGECTVESLKSKFNALSRVVLQALLKQLEESGALERRDEKLYAPGTLAKEKSQALQAEDPNETKILAVLAQHPCLELDELARQVDLDSKKLKGYLDVLGRKGKTELVNYEFVATRERILSAHELLSRLWQSKRDISPADFRDGLATSRKYALALLAYFDDHQITRRLNTGRVLLKGPPNQVRTTNQR